MYVPLETAEHIIPHALLSVQAQLLGVLVDLVVVIAFERRGRRAVSAAPEFAVRRARRPDPNQLMHYLGLAPLKIYDDQSL